MSTTTWIKRRETIGRLGPGDELVGDYNTILSGEGYTVFGNGNKIVGNQVIVRGHQNHIVGDSCFVTGEKTRIVGNFNTIHGDYTHHKGNDTTLIGNHVSSTGRRNTAQGSVVLVVDRDVIVRPDSQRKGTVIRRTPFAARKKNWHQHQLATYPEIPALPEPQLHPDEDGVNGQHSCVICSMRRRATLCHPCYHVNACVTCMAYIRPSTCPTCTTQLSSVIAIQENEQMEAHHGQGAELLLTMKE